MSDELLQAAASSREPAAKMPTAAVVFKRMERSLLKDPAGQLVGGGSVVVLTRESDSNGHKGPRAGLARTNGPDAFQVACITH